ncbi:MAG: flagellar hook-associated protein 1 [Solirubrobacteraceae bacterium]|nr:flagellar hook-associated protein 1 [Solirubrobacteraceae bacterium]
MTSISTFSGLQTSLRGLLAQQRSLDVTAHNIANAQTEGYTRQEAVLGASLPYTINSGVLVGGQGAQLGQGVDVLEFRRMRDSFLDLQYRAQNMSLGDKTATADGLARVEEQLGEPSDDAISGLLGKYWDAWGALEANPTDGAAKAAVVAGGQALTGALKDLDARLSALSGTAAAEYASLTSDPGNDVGVYANQLASLNQAIKEQTAAGRQPNDLLDQRDLVLDKLSELGQVSTSDTDGDGALDVSFGGAATPLVNGSTGAVTWPQTLTSPGGKLGALQNLQTTIAGYRTQLDAVASSLASGVNAAHGTPPFFTGTTAATIAVNVTVATLQGGTGAAGDNSIARAVGGLRNGAIDAGYTGLVRKVASDASEANRALTTQDSIVSTLSERRQSVSGVSLDEEMTNMIRFQRGYQASSRAMSTMDEMLDTLINRTGRVGL